MRDSEGITEEDGEEAEHQQSIRPVDHVFRSGLEELVVCADQQHDARENSQRDLLAECSFRDRDRGDDRGDSNDHQDIEDIASHHVADCQLGASLHGGDNAYCQFWGRGAESDDGQSNHKGRNVKTLGERRGAVGQEIGAGQDQRQA